MSSFTDNEFNLELVHCNNSRALIAGLKGFTLFWQQKVFIKFTCLFAFTRKCGTWLLLVSRTNCCGLVNGVCFEKAVRFIYQYSWNDNCKFLFLLHKSYASIINKESTTKSAYDVNFRNAILAILAMTIFFFFFRDLVRPRAASFLLRWDKVTNLKCEQLEMDIKL